MRILRLVCLTMTMNVVALFEYDRALVKAEKGEWKETVELLRALVADRSSEGQLLYDIGVAAYKNEEYMHAMAYFSEAMAALSKDHSLYEHTLFNRGNTHIKLNTLQKALNDYEQVLKINPNNERARTNRDIVQKMLEQQQKTEQERKEQGQQPGKDTPQTSDDQSDSKKSEEKEQSENSPENDPSDQSDSADQDTQEQQDQEKGKQESSQRESESKSEDEPDGERTEYDSQWEPNERTEQDNKEQQSDDAMSCEEKQMQQMNQESNIPSLTESDPYKDLEDWVVQALQDRDAKDSELNKQMIKETVRNQAGNHEQCW